MNRTFSASAIAAFLVLSCTSLSQSAVGDSGKSLLERNCGRCHAIAPDVPSPLKEAPNLVVVLSSYTTERLEFELSEGIGSKHRDMPQIQFTANEIRSIEDYLSGRE